MKTKTHARVLSWVLSICMIAALIPAMPAVTAEAAGDTLVYNFKEVANNAVSSGAYPFTGDSANGFEKATYEVTKNFGAPFEIFYAATDATYTGALAGFYSNLGLALSTQHSPVAGSTIRMKIKVENSGYYTMSSYINNGIGGAAYSGHKLNISLYNGSQGDSVTPTQLIVSDSFTPVFGASTQYGSKPVYLDSATEYIVDYTSVGVDTLQQVGNFYVYSLTLTGTNPQLTSSATIPTAMSTSDAAITTSFDVSSFSDEVISVTSDNSGVVSVDNNNGTCTITAKSNGFATVTVKATCGGGVISKDYNIAVRNAPAVGEYIYYFSGMVNDSFAFYNETFTNNGSFTLSSTSDRAIRAALVDNGFTTTADKLSSPWKIAASWRDPAPGKTIEYDTCNVWLTPKGFNVAVNGGTVYPAIAVDVADGWYTVDTDYDVSVASGTTNFKLWNGAEYLAESKVAIAEDTSFDLKPVYLTKDGTNAFYFITNNFPGTLDLYSMTLNAVEPEVEAQSTVPTSYTAGDAAATVAFKIGAMTPTSVTATSDSDAVTAAASGTAVTFIPVSAGTANVTVTATYTDGEYSKSVSKVYTITVSPKPLPENHDKFGVKGAYITKENDGTYKVTFLSAIDSLDYKKVGFNVTVGGAAQDMNDVVNVYSSVAVNSTTKGDETVNVASFGLDEGFVFMDSIEDIEEGATVTFQPYAIDLEGNEILGKVFTATIQ